MRSPWIFLLALSGCGSAVTPIPPDDVGKVVKWPRTTCDPNEVDDDRFVVDWSALERGKLEAATRRTVVPVRVEGCVMRVVLGCTVKRPYTFVATSRQREVMQLRDRDEIAARLPFLAARVGAGLTRASTLDVTMTVVGRYESGPTPITTADLEGDGCDAVTHVAAGVSVGAFAIATGNMTAVDGSAEIAHASHARERRRLDAAGVEASCENARRADTAPPDDCAIPLRLELVAVGAPKAAKAPSPPPTPIAEDTMRRSMEAAKKELAYCHRVARAASPDLSGVLNLSVRLARNGNVRSVGAKTEGNLESTLADCAVERVGHVVFPPADDDRPRVIAIPVLFRPLARGQ